jgi:hypothetical protein
MEILPNLAPSPREREIPLPQDLILQALDDVLSSPPFRNTQQCQNLLRYIVEHTLAGKDHLLRERVIGSEVFRRSPDYEPGEDPIVRLRAAEVRKRLAQYYQGVSEACGIHIEVPPGSYRASFQCKSPTPVAVPAPAAVFVPAVLPEAVLTEPGPMIESTPLPLPQAKQKSPGADLFGQLVGGGFLIAAIVIFLVLWSGSQAASFRAFWGPWSSSPKPVIIAIGSNAVYQLSDEVTDSYAKEHHLEPHGKEFFVPIDPDGSIRGRDLRPAYNTFVALGDVAAVSNIVAALTRQKQPFQERFPDDISFAELRSSPSLLVGGFNNPMNIELTKDLRFVFRVRNEIDDQQNPSHRWQLHASEDSHDTEDYAIINRLVQKPGNAPILSAAGMGQYGTEAAAEFICSPASISGLVGRLPKNWQTRNLQIVLHVKVVDFKPTTTEIVGLHTW